MSYEQERVAIATFMQAGLIAAGYAGEIHEDSHKAEPVSGDIRVTIQNGDVMQVSIGRTINRDLYVGILQIQVFYTAGIGSKVWRDVVDILSDLFHDVQIMTTGVAVDGTLPEFIRFSPDGRHGYIAGGIEGTQLSTKTFNVPFWRYEHK